MPLYVLGFEGMTRRLQHYDQPQWHPWVLMAGVGALIILCGIVLQIAQLTVSIRSRHRRVDLTGDPWDARTLEWATASPPPSFNFAVMPNVKGEEPYWGMKSKAREAMRLSAEPAYEPIEVPRNSPTGFITAFFAVIVGFALIWHIWWLAIVGLIGAYATFVVFAWRDVAAKIIPREEVASIDRANRASPCRCPAGDCPVSTPSTALRLPRSRGVIAPRPMCRREQHLDAPGHGEGGAGLQAHHRRLRFLGLPALRHRHVLRVLRRLCGVGRRDRRRTGRRATLRSAQRCDRDRLPARSRASAAGWRASPSSSAARFLTQIALLVTGLLGLVFLMLEVARVCRPGARRRRPLPQRFPLFLLHPGWLPRRARHRRPAVARHDDGAVLRQGLSPRHPRRYLCFSLFWHALDIIWVAIFTLVYLIGARA